MPLGKKKSGADKTIMLLPALKDYMPDVVVVEAVVDGLVVAQLALHQVGAQQSVRHKGTRQLTGVMCLTGVV